MKSILIKINLLSIVLYLAFYLLPLGWAQAAEKNEENKETLKVIIEGVEDQLKNNVEAYLEINELAGKPVPSESRLRWLYGRAKENIRRALQPFGYYQPTIDSKLEKIAGGWVATFRIKPGPPLRINKVDVQVLGDGSDDPAFQRVLANLPLAKGQILNHSRYEELKQTLQNIAAERGYFNARMKESEIRVNLDTYSAAIILHYDTGKRYYFGQITFDQNALAPQFLRRYLDFQPGDPYRVSSLLDLQSALINSEYFSQVQVSASPDKAMDHTIPVDVHLEPRKATQYTFGIGYATDTGFRGKIGVERRRANRWGHHYKAELIGSQIKYGLATEYVIPGRDPRTDSFALRANYTDENSDSKNARTLTVGVSKQHQVGKWLRISSLNYLWENFIVGGEEKTSQLLTPSLNWTRVSAEDRLYPKAGYSLNLQLQGASKYILSDISFIQGLAQVKWIKTLGDNNRLLLRGSLGATGISDDDFDNLPTSLRFYAGGDTSVRGYNLDSIGPRDAEGNVIGGQYLVVGSLEYQHQVRENWNLAAFVDSGDAFNDSLSMKTGVGVGVVWVSPVGPVRAYLASGLDRPPGDAFRLHLIIGPDL